MAGGDVQVTLQMADDGLYIFDASGKRLHLWPYAAIMNARADFVLAHNSHPDVRLTVGDHGVYQAIALRASQLSQPPERFTRAQEERTRDAVWSSMSVRTFLIILLGTLAVSAIGTLLLR